MGFKIGPIKIRGGVGAERGGSTPAGAAEFRAPAPGSLAPALEAATAGFDAVNATANASAQERKPTILKLGEGVQITLNPDQADYLNAQITGAEGHAGFGELPEQLVARGFSPDNVAEIRSHILAARREQSKGDHSKH